MIVSIRAILSTLLFVFSLATTNNTFARDPKLEQPKESAAVEPELQYGQVKNLALPKTIFFGAGVDNILADAPEWSQRGVSAFFVDYVAREWSTDIWASDGKPWTIGASDETLQKAQQASALCRKVGAETFLKISFDHTFDWFDDTSWQRIDNNFRQFAIFARDAGFDGIALDVEYISKQYTFEWEGYSYDGYTRQDLVKKIDARMTRVIQILYDEFPEMVFLTFPEQGLGLGGVIHRAWVEEAARRDAPGGVHYCVEWTYRNSNIRHIFGHVWACHELFHRILSDQAWKYWQQKCSIAAGIWPFSSDDYRLYGPGISLEQLRQGLAATLMTSRRYNWIYGSYTQEQLLGRELDKYDGKEDIHAHLQALATRQMVTDAKWVDMAKELRSAKLRDYSADLQLVPTPVFVGPDDDVQVQLVPKSPAMPNASGLVYDQAWEFGLKIFRGEEVNLKQHFGTITNWMIIGPFASDPDFSGHHTVYPPETTLDLQAAHEGLDGKTVRWVEHDQDGSRTSVDFKSIFATTKNVCAYALCYVTCPEERRVWVRVGTNDSGKMWIGGQGVYNYPHDGQAILDRDVFSVLLPKGTTPILLKVCNGDLDWGFVFRMTDQTGKPSQGLKFSVSPN